MVTAFDDGNRLARPNVHAFNAALNACAFSGTTKGMPFVWRGFATSAVILPQIRDLRNDAESVFVASSGETNNAKAR
jgi:hypothetical protein